MNQELADKTEAYFKKAWKNFGGPNAKEENFCRDIIENMVLFWDMWTLKQNQHIKSVDALYDYYQSKWEFEPVKFDDVCTFLSEKPENWEELVELAAEYSSEELKNIILNFKPFSEANIEKVPSGINILAEELLEINEEDRLLIVDYAETEFIFEAKKSHPQTYMQIFNGHYTKLAAMAMKADVLGIEKVGFSEDDIIGNFNKTYICTHMDTSSRSENSFLQEIVNIMINEGIEIPIEFSGEWSLCAYSLFAADDVKKGVAVMNSADMTLKQNEKSRQFFVQKGLIEGVILLPQKMYTNTWINPYLVIFSLNNDKIRFLDASDCYTKEQIRNRRMNIITEKEVTEIVTNYHDDAKVRIVNAEEIAKNGYNLSPLRYILDENPDEKFAEMKEYIKEIKRGASLKASVMDEYISEEKSKMKCVRVPQLISGVIDDNMYFHGEINKPEKNMAHKGDILLSKVGAPFKVAVADDDYLVIGNIYIISIDRQKISAEYLKCFLASSKGQREINRLSAGAATPNLSVEEIGNIRIPTFDQDEQIRMESKAKAIESDLQSSFKKIRDCNKKLEKLFD